MKGKKDIVRVSATTHLQEFLWARPIHPYSLLPSWGVGDTRAPLKYLKNARFFDY